MLVAIRVDASLKMGTGHVFRMLTLAKELTRQNHEVIFICRALPGNLISMIENSHPVYLLPLPRVDDNNDSSMTQCAHATWLEVNYSDEISHSKLLLSTFLQDHSLSKFDWLIIDHYAIEQDWHEKMRPLTHFILQIDDLADRLFDCDLLLDQNYYSEGELRYQNLTPHHAQLAVGPKYSLLRPEFSRQRNNLQSYKQRLMQKNVVIFFGGIDAVNETEKALLGLLKMDDSQDFFQVIIGINNPHRARLENLCKQHTTRVSLHVQVNNMMDFFARSFLYVGAVGATTWERCVLGLPGLVCSVADNQVKLAEELQSINGHFYLGKHINLSSDDYANAYRDLLHNEKQLSLQSEICTQLIDGDGCRRVVEMLTHFTEDRKH